MRSRSGAGSRSKHDAKRGGGDALLLGARDGEAVRTVVAEGDAVLLARVRVDVNELAAGLDFSSFRRWDRISDRIRDTAEGRDDDFPGGTSEITQLDSVAA